MSDTQMQGAGVDPNSWLAKMRAARPDLFPPGSGTPVAQPLGAGFQLQPLGAGAAPQGMPQTGMPAPQNANYNPFVNMSPPPAPPDVSGQMGTLGEIRAGIARNEVLPVEQQQAMNQARVAGLQAQIAGLPQHDPNNPAFQWNPITPQGLGTPQMAPIATRPAPGIDPQSRILAAIGGLFDPKGAGNYNAQPLEAGIHVANQQYQDQLQQNALLQQQYLQQYQAGKENAQQANQFGVLNQEQGQQAAMRGLSDAQRLQEQASALSGGLTQAQAEASPLQDFISRTRDVTQSGAAAQTVQDQIQRAYQTWQTQMTEWEKTLSPAARVQAMTERMYGENLMNQLKMQTSAQNNQNNNATKVQTNQNTVAGQANVAQINQAGANQRNAATNATSTQNNIRNNAGNADGSVSDTNLLKVPEVKMANDQYMKTLDVYNKLLAQQARDHNQTPLGKAALQQTITDLRNSKAYLDQAVVKARATQTQTPGGVGQTRPNATGTAPGAPAAPPTFRYDASGHRIP